MAIEAPGAGELLVANNHRGHTVFVKYSKPHSGFSAVARIIHLYQWRRKIRNLPFLFARIPKPGLAQFFVADDHVEIAVIVQIQKADPIILTIGSAKWLAG